MIFYLLNVHTYATADLDRAGNVLTDSNEVSVLAIPAVVVSGLVLHFFGEQVLFKLWGVFFLSAIVIGLLKRIF